MWKCNHIRAFNHSMDFKRNNDDIFVEKEFEGMIYVGGVDSAYEGSAKKYGFTHVIHLHDPGHINYVDVSELHILNCNDYGGENLIKRFEKCFKFLDEALSENKEARILIHCLAGISRSSSICAAYIMRKKKISFDKLLTAMRIDRRIIRPNKGFRDQLRMFEWNGFKVDQKLIDMSEIMLDPDCTFIENEKKLERKDFEEIEKLVKLAKEKKEVT